MGKRYCPYCDKLVETKVLPNNSQIIYQGVLVKTRRILHQAEKGGCGKRWTTIEKWILDKELN